MVEADFRRALAELGVEDDTLGPEEKACLEREGYLVLGGLIDADWLAGLRAAFDRLAGAEGADGGREAHTEAGTQRLGDLVNKDPVFDGVYTHPRVLAAVWHVLGRPFRLSSLNGREAMPGEGLQELHADWGDPPAAGEPWHVVNSLWLLDDYTGRNGSTRVVPRSHLERRPIGALVEDRLAPHPREVVLRAPAGTVVVINSHLWHGGTRNESGERRRVCHAYFAGREHGQQTCQQAHLRPETAARLSPAAAMILDVRLE